MDDIEYWKAENSRLQIRTGEALLENIEKNRLLREAVTALDVDTRDYRLSGAAIPPELIDIHLGVFWEFVEFPEAERG